MNPYFGKFNYSLANEDASIEQSEARPYRSIVAVTGSGARLIPHLNADVDRLTAVDVSEAQLTYLKLKRALVQNLSDDDYLKVLGYRRASRAERLSLLDRVRLTDEESRLAKWEASLDEGLVYQGAWETNLRRISRKIRLLLGTDFTPLFEAKSLEEQREIFQSLWPKKRLTLLMKIFASRRAINRAVYGGGLPEGESLSDFLLSNFIHYFQNKSARSSFFHQLLFLGELRYAEGWPLETSADSLKNFRAFGDRLSFFHGDILMALEPSQAEFLSLSDVASYLPASSLRELAHRLEISLTLRHAVVRTFLRHPRLELGGDWRFRERSADQDVTGLYRISILNRGEP